MLRRKRHLRDKSDIREKKDRSALSMLEVMLTSREVENRENILFRQGRGLFHLPSAGHEAMAGLASLIKSDDWLYCYYRDRALLLAMGVPLEEMALGYFGKEKSSSGGRQMSSHFCYKPLNIVSCASPTALQCLPSTGTAWAFKKQGRNSIVYCCIGEASTRQGEFFEALAFAEQEKLPVIFIVEDNGYGISTPTKNLTPLSLGFLPKHRLNVLDARDPEDVYDAFLPAIHKVRAGEGPQIMWLKMDRIMSHTSSDDQTRYRTKRELSLIGKRDPVNMFCERIINKGVVDREYISLLSREIKEKVKNTYLAAEKMDDPRIELVELHKFSSVTTSKRLESSNLAGKEIRDWSMSQAFNLTLGRILSERNNVLVFGEDVEDPKGGVFGLTKGLSSAFPDRVINSPLAEATIAGISSGLSMAGILPIFELQFIDFLGPAFNQIVNQIATLRWRSVGRYKCPLVIYAPCGSYISGGGPWHSQTNEGWLAHAPGIKVYMPSNANDAANMLYSAAYGDDPVIMLLPKNQFQRRVSVRRAMPLYPEKARIVAEGGDLTIVSWGNCVEVASQARGDLAEAGIDAEIIDLRSIVPCDWRTIHKSVQKTGRLIVIQEDNKTCSFGQAIISETMSDNNTWKKMISPPILLSRDDVHIGFNEILRRGVLPQSSHVVDCSYSLLGMEV